MNKIILIPTDYSPGATHALAYAAALAKKEKASLLLLHAYHTPYILGDAGYDFPEDAEEMQKTETKRLRELCTQIERKEKVKCSSLVRNGFAVDVILGVINEKQPQMVVMGTKGAGWLKEMIIGSNTAQVIGKASCPVIAVPEQAVYNGIRHITYATDYHASDVTALRRIVEIAKPFRAEITVIHVSDDEFTPDTDEELLAKFKALTGKKVKYDKIAFRLVHGKQLEKVLQDHIKNENPDLLAMSTHYRGILDKIFGTSVTRKMAYHSRIPLLAFHHKHESVVFI